MTEVLLTVDLEFDVNGFISQPEKRRPAGVISVRRPRGKMSHGLERILETAERHQIPITFFVEVFNAHYFGLDEMGGVVEEIRESGLHDIQLHTHPIWRLVGGKSAPEQVIHDRQDRCAQRPDSVQLMAEAVELFRQLTGDKPIAFRPGSFNVDRNLLRAAAAAGIKVTSACSLGNPSVDTELHLGGGIHHIDGIIEAPITAFRESTMLFGERFRSATVCGNAMPMLKDVLVGRKAGGPRGPVVLLTHASEFSARRFLPDRFDYVPNNIVSRRFASLCRFIDGNRDSLTPTTFSAAWRSWKPLHEDIRTRWYVTNVLQRLPQLVEEFAKRRFLPAAAIPEHEH